MKTSNRKHSTYITFLNFPFAIARHIEQVQNHGIEVNSPILLGHMEMEIVKNDGPQ